ncbi:hypothetical protein P43SY_001463 [Pythium insidiosum]|uniref:Peptidase A1 domain-containing protein n=1 Tax=Pythium insidiosum TaxID=114742 RepID=A0AAD5QCD7_PYTIN|nr:hypothetical protein P43SY_001463 [Pythium insidiosum]
MSTPVTLPIKFLADDAPTVVATVGSTERTLLLHITCANVLVRCVDETKCPNHCSGGVEIINYSSYDSSDIQCVLPTNATVSTKGFTSTKNFRVGQLGLDVSNWRIPTRADGIFGLGPESRDSFYMNELRLSGSTDNSVLSTQLSSFSLSLGATATDGGSLILNGMDDARVTEEKLKGYNVKLENGNGYDLDVKNVLWDGVDVSSFVITPYQLDTTLDGVQVPSNAWSKIWDMLSGSCTSKFENLKTEYSCNVGTVFPPLGLTFGDSTFYLTKEQYTAPHPKYPSRVLLKLSSGDKAYRLGLPFLRAFPVQIFPGSSVTIYCNEGRSCAKNVVPKSPKRTRSPSSPNAAVTEQEDIEGSSLASTMHNIGWWYAIISTIVLVILIIAAIVRKQRNASKITKDPKHFVAGDIPVVELTPKSAEADFVDAETPKKYYVS